MPLFDFFWALLWVFLWIAWIWLLVMVLFDLFRSHDLGGWGKGLWAVFIIFLPFLGVFIYLIARGGQMQQRRIDDAKAQEAATREYVQSVAGSSSSADELEKLSRLRDQGTIDDAEFQQMKAKVLGS